MGDLKKKVDIEQALLGTKADQPRSSCSIFALVITLVIILLILVTGLFYLKFKDYKFVVQENQKNQNLDLRSKIEKQIEDQSGEESLTITVTDDDINSLLKGYANFPLKDPSAKINESGITISGKYGLINVDVLVLPKVENGKINYEIKEIKAAGVTAPKKISDAVSSELSNFISSKMPNTKKIYVEKVVLKDALFQATGKKR